MHAYRSHSCTELTATNVGDTVRLSGWVNRVRDHGGILFIDLRDHYGITQILCDPDSAAFADVEKVRSEWCIRIDGEVKARNPELVNAKLPTGEVEVFIREIEVISGTALDTVLVRRLQHGDVGGHMRRGLAAFPVPAVAERILARYFKAEAEQDEKPSRLIAGFRIDPSANVVDLTIAANFVEVFLAKEGHQGHVGVNFLEKIQMPNLTSMFGAMLAGVDNVLMGAGIPRTIPGILDALSEWKPVEMRINVEDADKEDAYFSRFDPLEWIRSHLPDIELPKLKRPDFFPIISSNVLAITLAKKSTGKVNGFIVERHVAGGHNAPPRGGMTLDEKNEPIYGVKDEADLAQLSKTGAFLSGSLVAVLPRPASRTRWPLVPLVFKSALPLLIVMSRASPPQLRNACWRK